ncbi:MAG TPA: PTS sugar transporter subunit IIA [Planctomycetes bacterium]|nr:PTS sugar transporter subunit IIA [Planctomycetota bacterium]
MNLQELLPREDILVGFEAADKWDAIERLVGHLAERERIPTEARAELLEALLDRERSMSTGMEHGVAIPHAAVHQLDELVGCLAITLGEGLDFESIDGSPARFIVLLLIPRAQKLVHIRTLASIARVLAHSEIRDALLEAQDPDEAWAVLGRTAAETH